MHEHGLEGADAVDLHHVAAGHGKVPRPFGTNTYDPATGRVEA
jgi:hypothetical protein